jgi:putative membrane protein
MIFTMVRLRWALTFSVMRKSIWQKIGFAIAIVFGLALICALGFAGWETGKYINPGMLADTKNWQEFQVAPIMVASIVSIFTLFINVFMFGSDTTLKSRSFALYGIPYVKQQAGMLLGSLFGALSVSFTIALALWSLAYRSFGIVPVLVSVIAAPLYVATIVSLSKMLIELLDTILINKRSRNIFYFAIFIAYMIFVSSMNTHSPSPNGIALGTSFCAASAFTPLSAAMALPLDAINGNWLALAIRFLICVVTIAACFAISVFCAKLEPKLLRGEQKTVVKTKGIGLFAAVPDNTVGAIIARIISVMRRDMRQLFLLIAPLFMLVVAGGSSFKAKGFDSLTDNLGVSGWMMYAALLMGMVVGNNIAYDGTAFTMHAIIGVKGLHDRLANAIVWSVICAVYFAIIGVGVYVFLFFVANVKQNVNAVMFQILSPIGIAFASIGIGLISSCIAMYPVASIEKPFSRPQGSAGGRSFAAIGFMLLSVVCMIPSVAAAIAFMILAPQLLWIASILFVVNGLIVLVVGVILGGKVMDKRMIRIVENLRRFASITA